MKSTLASDQKSPPRIKCVVWDLDNTLWDGTLLENDVCKPREQAAAVIRQLDQWGVLHSIASRNILEPAMTQLTACGLQDYFLFPQIDPGRAKSDAIRAIAAEINIGLDSMLFVDDDPFEREEVAFTLPMVACVDAADIARLPGWPGVKPDVVTEDAARRRQMMLGGIRRRQEEETFEGPRESFLRTLDMVFNIRPAQESDLARARELTLRTNQLNTTGYTYSFDELRDCIDSPEHRLLIAELRDRFGDYGKIGLALLDCRPDAWTIKLLLMSCRVMSRGVGSALINVIRRDARRAGVKLFAEFVPTDRNRMMLVTYRFAGFDAGVASGPVLRMQNDLTRIPPDPDYLRINAALHSSPPRC